MTRRLLRPACGVRTHGFTLLEVLVALTIVAVALTATMRAMGSMTTASDSLQTRMIATWSAENHLANLRLARVFPDPGARGFACPQGDTQLWCEETIASTPNPVFRRVEVSVYPDASKSVRLAWLVTLLPNDARNVF
ncbi:type II secretion system protein GspI [Ralstonia sp. TCR112]|uniref:type II secretion system minor pseudopilin GspI n=1 Tax=Ralstonia sp. TCR112 TaxID=2601730 RepID=UPI0011BFC5D4|nr:type II secretion system minor pseudopilin GspI [Ralstonia sp. TCR112]TXD54741.1 type II secretion system protein GspI [Ralstonia sp. TCR112]